MKLLEPIVARQQLKEILAQEEYQVYYQEEQQNLLLVLLDKLKNWLFENLKDLFPNIKITEGWAEWITYATIGAGVLLFVLLIFFLLSKIVREGKISPKTVGTAEDLALSSSKHLEEANDFANREDYRFALRHLFLALILHLDNEKLIDAKPWKTNWEYYYELNSHESTKANSFQLIAAKFDEAMYGGLLVNKEDYEPIYNKIINWLNGDRQSKIIQESTDKGGMV